MALTRYQPADLMNRLQEDINNLFRSSPWGRWPPPLSEEASSIVTSDWMPAVDIKEEDARFVVHADVPGVQSKDIEVTLDNGILSISGQRRSEAKEDRNGYHRVERAYGAFHRRFSLPDTADPERVSAKVHDGVLEITVAKKKAAEARKIKIES